MENPTPINEEYKFDDGLIVSSTDLKGIITYANRKFCEIAGYTKDELVGKNHNIIRHPDMPSTVFKELWEDLQTKGVWTGIVKNLRKDGRYYWVYTFIESVIVDGRVIGYSAARRPALARDLGVIKPIYEDMAKKERSS